MKITFNSVSSHRRGLLCCLGGFLHDRAGWGLTKQIKLCVYITVNVLSYLTRQSTARKWIIEFGEIWTFTEKDVLSE